MLRVKFLLLDVRQRNGGTHSITDLAAVKAVIVEIVRYVCHQSGLVLVRKIHLPDKDGPDLAALDRIESLQANGHVDARLEGLVDIAGTVSGQEEDAVEVLQFAEEDGDESVSAHVVDVAFLEEDVGLVHEQDGFPGDGVAEDFFEAFLEFEGLGAQVAAADGVEGSLLLLGDALGGQGFAGSGGAVEEDGQAAAFASDDVGEAGIFHHVCLDHGDD